MHITQNYITGCPKFCFKAEIGLKMNGTLFCRDGYYNTKTFCIEFQKLRDEKLKPLRAQSKIYFSFVIESTN
ncbi:hypothetical protein [Leptospira santarosai]|uniref:hypothetical protein n=1 Tax=Leptospira santarosai TaxID=28183 RepID=UPI00399FB4DD